MAGDELFGGLPEQRGVSSGLGLGPARLREPVRDQIELRACDLEALLAADHPARVIWAYVAGLDLSDLEEAVKARAHGPGQAPASPRLLLALWLYATSEGVGSARELDRLCLSHDAYRWLCGGVALNYHGLADFRTGHGALLDRLLAWSVASLASEGLIDLDEVAQDGVKVRAGAGAASFRRRPTLEQALGEAKALVERLKQEEKADPGASSRRVAAARQRAARERLARVEAALSAMAELEALRKKRETTNAAETARQKAPRASTSDPQARVMKMADGGFRPAFNGQIATVARGQIVVGCEAGANGSDRGLAPAMIAAVAGRHGRWPERWLHDGGFTKHDDTDWAAAHGVAIHGPAPKSKHKTEPYAARPDDSEAVAAWRARMASEAGKKVYRRRAMHECVNARFRQWGLVRFTVRGLQKVRTVLHWFALANNILQGHRLQTEARRALAA